MNELEVLADVANRFESIGVDYMLTGSFAMNFYAEPRMTRDLDLIVEVRDHPAQSIERAFFPDYYLSTEAIAGAVAQESSFNLIHQESVLKIDCMVRKGTPHRRMEFTRRRRIAAGAHEFWIVAVEDLIIAKLDWARDSKSTRQLEDVRNLLKGDYDREYLQRWIVDLGLESAYSQAADE